jgi:hypothetical protein
MQTWKKTYKPIQIKSNMNAFARNQMCVFGMLLALCSDGVYCVYFVIRR